MLKCWTGTGARPAVYMGFGTVYSRFCLPGHPKGHCSAKAGFKMEFKDMDISRNLSEESHSYRQSDPAFCVHILPPGFPHRPRCEWDTCTPIRPDVLESQIYCRENLFPLLIPKAWISIWLLQRFFHFISVPNPKPAAYSNGEKR